jgi:branched-chain amino acid transport system ATP-binding protein
MELNLDEGEIVAVLGPNGVGKTTFLKTIAGLVAAREGVISLDGRHINRSRAEARARAGVLLVPEGRRLFPSLTVIENLRAGVFTGRKGLSIDEALELFPRLAERGDSRARSLSGGEQQMLAIGRALCGGPRVLLIDEPSLGLAPLVTASVFETFRRLADRGISIVLGEQNVMAAVGVADRCVLMESGATRYSGSCSTAEDRSSVEREYEKMIDVTASV